MTEPRTAIASHRGGAFLWPENSMTAFRATAGLALEQVECDVHASADGDAVVMHDATLDRTTDGSGPVAALPTSAVTRLRVKGCAGGTVPLLGEMLDVYRGTAIAPRIEVKGDTDGRPYRGLVPRVMAALDQSGLRRKSWVIAFDAGTAAEAQAAGGLAGVAWLMEGRTYASLGIRGAIAVTKAYGFPEIGLPQSVLDAEGCAAFQGAGIRVSVWGANHEASIRRMLGLGIECLTTDDPPLAIALRG